MRNIFIEKSHTKCAGESLYKQFEILCSLFLMPKSITTKINSNYGADYLLLHNIKLFKKQKEVRN